MEGLYVTASMVLNPYTLLTEGEKYRIHEAIYGMDYSYYLIEDDSGLLETYNSMHFESL